MGRDAGNRKMSKLWSIGGLWVEELGRVAAGGVHEVEMESHSRPHGELSWVRPVGKENSGEAGMFVHTGLSHTVPLFLWKRKGTPQQKLLGYHPKE